MEWARFGHALGLRSEQTGEVRAQLDAYRAACRDLWLEPTPGVHLPPLDVLADRLLRAARFESAYTAAAFERCVGLLGERWTAGEADRRRRRFRTLQGEARHAVEGVLDGGQTVRLHDLQIDLGEVETGEDPLGDVLTGRMADMLLDGHSPTFCILPWIHAFVDVNGDVKLCCEATNDHGERNPNLQRQPLAAIWNSDRMREVRRRMVAGQRVAACSRCTKEDALGQTSSRQHYNAYWLRRDRDRDRWRERIRRSLRHAFEVSSLPSYYDIRPGNRCTLKCRMCHADYSHLIQGDPVHSRWAHQSPEMRAARLDSGSMWYDPGSGFAGSLLEQIEATRRFYFAGGEPLVNPFILELIDALVDRDLAGNIGLEISTNLTLFPEDLFEKLARFESVQLAVSVDGFGEVYEYIRYPGTWQRIAANLRLLGRHPRIQSMVTTTVQNYNVLVLDRLYEFTSALGLPLNLNLLYSPRYLHVGVMPRPAKAEARRRLAALRERAAASPLGQRHHAMLLKMDNVITELDQESEDAYRSRIDEFMRFTNDLDGSRGQRFRAVCPELVRFLADDGIEWVEGAASASSQPG